MALAFGLLAGCALYAPMGPHRPVGPRVTTYEPDTTGVYSDVPYDSLRKLLEQVTRDASARTARAPSGNRRAEAPKATETTIPSDTLADHSPDTLAVSPVSVALPEAERRALVIASVADLQRVTAVVAAAEQRGLTEAQNEKLRTIRGLIEQAQEALLREDLRAAANLAHKARLLGEALPPP